MALWLYLSHDVLLDATQLAVILVSFPVYVRRVQLCGVEIAEWNIILHIRAHQSTAQCLAEYLRIVPTPWRTVHVCMRVTRDVCSVHQPVTTNYLFPWWQPTASRPTLPLLAHSPDIVPEQDQPSLMQLDTKPTHVKMFVNHNL
jgi:hypothetical protein